MRNAVKAVLERDEALAKRVIQEDHLIDTAEVDVEEECLKILALHQPVAHDLRYIVAMLKINHDLERISDLAVTIAKRAVALCSLPEPNVEFEISSMAEKTVQMVARSLDALINRDANLARDNWFSDDEVDAMCARNYDLVEEQIRKHPEHLSALLSLLNVSRNLERIADHATNISKDVIYMIEGEIVRHRKRAIRQALAQSQPPS